MLAVILLFGVIVYITRGILAPLLKLVACMHKLAGHDTEIAIPSVERDDEIGAMALRKNRRSRRRMSRLSDR
jgi:hypothetical protein